MNHPKSKRRLRVQLAFVYTLMAIAVISIVAILILVIQGYRYNRYDGKLEQGGLVQFNSRPAGATVTVDGVTLGNKTASKITLTSGRHEITMARDGYTNWKKQVTVKPGGVLWLNYAQLFPTAPTVTTSAAFAAVDSALASPDRKLMAVIPASTTPEISLVTLNSDTSTTTKVTIPTDSFTAPENGATQAFNLISWDKDSHMLLIKHTYGDKTEYLSTDIRNGVTYNISTRLGVDVAKVMYSRSDSNVVYILTTTHELRRGNSNDTVLSGPIATNISDMAMTEQNLLTYTTLADNKGVRTVGYVSSGSTKAKTIASYSDIGAAPLDIATGNYYGDRYTAVLHGQTLDIFVGSLPGSDNTGNISLTRVAQAPAVNGEDTVGFSPGDNRIVYATHGTTAVAYDLELAQSSLITLAGTTPAVVTKQSSVTPGLQWFDNYHVMTTGGPLYVYDYDGTNGQLIANTTANQPAVLGSGEKYLYYFVTADGSAKLQRLQLTIN